MTSTVPATEPHLFEQVTGRSGSSVPSSRSRQDCRAKSSTALQVPACRPGAFRLGIANLEIDNSHSCAMVCQSRSTGDGVTARWLPLVAANRATRVIDMPYDNAPCLKNTEYLPFRLRDAAAKRAVSSTSLSVLGILSRRKQARENHCASAQRAMGRTLGISSGSKINVASIPDSDLEIGLHYDNDYIAR